MRHTFVKSYEHMVTLIADLPGFNRHLADSNVDMARGYAWGRTDTPGYAPPAHGGDALDFSVCYGIHYVTNSQSKLAVREAFDRWHAGTDLPGK